ncbi:hypothetical protein ACFRAR_15685 [Kitasatospora sp. NPDC056651]
MAVGRNHRRHRARSDTAPASTLLNLLVPFPDAERDSPCDS